MSDFIESFRSLNFINGLNQQEAQWASCKIIVESFKELNFIAT
jgi:hypothetical protein